VQTALRVALRWPGSTVWSAPCLKPLHDGPIVSIGRRHGAIITLEEHSIHGGIGSAVAEIATSHAPTWVCRIGIPDRFSRACGSHQYLLAEHELDDEAITRKVQGFVDSLPGHVMQKLSLMARQQVA
jgi:transketolase